MNLDQVDLFDSRARRQAYKGILAEISNTWELAPRRVSPWALGAALRRVLVLFEDTPVWEDPDFAERFSEGSEHREVFLGLIKGSLHNWNLTHSPADVVGDLLLFIRAAHVIAGASAHEELDYIANLEWTPTVRGGLRLTEAS